MLFLISAEAYMSATTIASAQMTLVSGDDVGLTKNVNPCILVPPANSRNTCKTTISRFRNWNWNKCSKTGVSTMKYPYSCIKLDFAPCKVQYFSKLVH